MNFRTEEGNMADSMEVRSHFGHSSAFQMGDPQKTSWGEAVLGGLPHMLAGLALGLPMLLVPADQPSMGSALAFILTYGIVILLILAILGSFVLAWRRGWPRWAASWYFY
jgi:hypothetical protein